MDIPETALEERPEKGPGSLLTEARLRLGLEPHNVAEMLHLRIHQIHALEADDYESLPEPTYVKGYLRAYCQLLSLDPDVIVKRYSDLIKPAVSESFEGIAPDKQTVSSDSLVKLFSAGLVVLVAGLTITFWYSSKNSPADNMTSGTDYTAAPLAEQSNPSSAEESQAHNQVAFEPAKDVAVVPAEVEKVNPPVTSNPGATVTTTAPESEASDVVSATVAAPPAAKTNQASLLPESDELARSRLLVRVNESSWVDVRDARDNKLIYETVPSGREIPLEGLAPFKVFLGNASGVQIFLEGNAYDFSLHQRGLTARFSLGKAPGAR